MWWIIITAIIIVAVFILGVVSWLWNPDEKEREASFKAAYEYYGEKAKGDEANKLLEKDLLDMTAEELFNLGNDYYKGENGKSQDYEKALALFSEAAEKGHVIAIHAVGMFYFNGHVVELDYDIAQAWLEDAISLGRIEAFWALETILTKLDKFPYGYERLIELAEKLLESNYERVRPMLAEYYTDAGIHWRYGDRTNSMRGEKKRFEENHPKAKVYLTRAVELGSELAKKHLGYFEAEEKLLKLLLKD